MHIHDVSTEWPSEQRRFPITSIPRKHTVALCGEDSWLVYLKLNNKQYRSDFDGNLIQGKTKVYGMNTGTWSHHRCLDSQFNTDTTHGTDGALLWFSSVRRLFLDADGFKVESTTGSYLNKDKTALIFQVSAAIFQSAVPPTPTAWRGREMTPDIHNPIISL